MVIGAFHKDDAIEYALDLLRMQGEEFGSPDAGWGLEDAWELVDEDATAWDGDKLEINHD